MNEHRRKIGKKRTYNNIEECPKIKDNKNTN